MRVLTQRSHELLNRLKELSATANVQVEDLLQHAPRNQENVVDVDKLVEYINKLKLETRHAPSRRISKNP